MNILIKLEEAAKLVAAYLLTLHLGYGWWVFILLLFVPDVSIAGYLISSRIGAVVYNFFHHQGIALGIGIAGVLMRNEALNLAAIMLFGHSALDRMFGYGLKYNSGFRFTHLGTIDRRTKT